MQLWARICGISRFVWQIHLFHKQYKWFWKLFQITTLITGQSVNWAVLVNRLYNFLEITYIIIKEQSEFRNKRWTADNLLFMTQKFKNAYLEAKKCAVFFMIFLKPKKVNWNWVSFNSVSLLNLRTFVFFTKIEN